MRCPRRLHPNRESARFCGECGASLGRGVACPRCATLNPADQRFCDACGARLSAPAREGRARDPRAYTPRHLVERILTTRSALAGDDLQEAQFIHELAPSPQPRHGFQHPLTREVAYHSQLGEQRAHLHARMAIGLEKLRADRLGECAALIGHHWEASGRPYEAARWHRRAALNVSNIVVKGRRS
jgi:hypothetical protein